MFLLNVSLMVIFNFEFFYLSSDHLIQQSLSTLQSLMAIRLLEQEKFRF